VSGSSASKVERAKAPESISGDYVLNVPGNHEGVVIRQKIEDVQGLDPSVKSVKAGVWGKASGPASLGLVLAWGAPREQQRFLKLHPGDGQWHELTLHEEVASGDTKNGFVFSIICKADGEEPVQIGPASLMLADQAPPEQASRQNLLQNGDFDALGFWDAEKPKDWLVRTWGGNEMTDVEFVRTPDRPKGHYAVSFPKIETGTLALAQKVELTEADHGKRLVAQAWAKGATEKEVHLILIVTPEGGERQTLRRVVTKPGEWQLLRLWYDVPEEGPLPAVEYVLARYGSDKAGEALADAASLRLEEAPPA